MMTKLHLHFLGYAGIAFLLALVSVVMLPVYGGIPAILQLTDERFVYGLLGISALFIIWTSLQMLRQAIRELKTDGTGSVLLVVLGQVMLFSVTTWQYLTQESLHDLFMGVTLPLFFLSISVVYLTLNWAQNQEEQWFFPKDSQKGPRALLAIILLMSMVGLVVFAYRGDLLVAVLVSGALLLVVEPRWGMLRVGELRKRDIHQLEQQGIKVISQYSLDKLPEISDVIIEKDGVITENSYKIYSVNSLTKDLSEYDVLTIVASLEAQLPDDFSQSVVAYAQEHGVYPVAVEEQTVLPSIGVQGEVFGTEYALVMASYAHEQQYQVNAKRLEATLALGNSVRLLVQGNTVIGAVNYGESFRRNLVDLDRYFKTYDMDVRLATTDTMGSVRPVREMMKSVVTVQADLTAAQQYAQQVSWTKEVPTLFLTTGALPAKADPAVVVKSGNNERGADIMVTDMTQLSAVHTTAMKLKRLSFWTTVRWSIWSILLIGALFLADLVFDDWLVGPTFAILIRTTVTLFLSLLDPDVQ